MEYIHNLTHGRFYENDNKKTKMSNLNKLDNSIVTNTTELKLSNSNKNSVSRVLPIDIKYRKFSQREYFYGTEPKINSSLINSKGTFDTSRKYIHINKRNFIYNKHTPTYKPNIRFNDKGKQQGDGIKHKSLPLPPQKFKIHNKEENEIVSGPFFYPETDIDYEFDADFMDELDERQEKLQNEYVKFLRDDIVNQRVTQSKLDIQIIDQEVEKEEETNNKKVVLHTDRGRVQINSFKQTKKFYEIAKLCEYSYNYNTHHYKIKYHNLVIKFDFVPFSSSNFIMCNNARTTQSFGVMASYIASAVTAVGTAMGYYYMYRSMKVLIDTTSSVSQDFFGFLKNNLIDLLFIISTFYGVYTGELSIKYAVLVLTSKAFITQVDKELIQNIVDFILSYANRVSDHSTNRHTQGANDSLNFVQGVLALIGTFIFGSKGTVDVNSILSGIKSLGSTILTVKTLDSILCQIVTYFPDIIMLYLAQMFPKVYIYILSSNDKKFKEFMEKVVDLKTKNMYDILYHSHNLHTFLELHNYFINDVLNKDNVARGVGDVLGEYIQWFDEVHKKADEMGLLPGKRRLPFVIWISGDPGVGKSTYAKTLAKDLAKEIFPDTPDQFLNKHIYTYNTANDYIDSYHNQYIFVINDYLQFMKQQEEQHLIRFADTLDVLLNPSSVDNEDSGIKGEVRFTSRIIIITSNITHLEASTEIVSPEALNRRRDILVEMTWKGADKSIDFENFDYSWAKITVLPKIKTIWDNRPVLELEPHNLTPYVIRKLEEFSIRQNLVLVHNGFDFKDENLCALKLQQQREIISALESFYDKVATYVSDTLNTPVLDIYTGDNNGYASYLTKIPGLGNLKHLKITIGQLLGLSIAGTVGYMAYKSIAQFLVNNHVQSLSGDVTTRKYAPERKPLKRQTMSVVSNTMDMMALIARNICKISVTISNGKILCTQHMYGIFLGGTMVITPLHLWQRGQVEFKWGDKINIEFKDVKYTFTVNKEDLFLHPTKDVACLNVLFNIPPVKSIEHLFLPTKSTISVNGEDGFLLLMHRVNTVLPVTAYIMDAPYTDEDGLFFSGKNVWQYNNTKTLRGECGSPLIINMNGRQFIAGMHIAGDTYSGNSEVLDGDTISEMKAYFNRTTQGYATNAYLDDDEWFDAESDFDNGFIFLGGVKPVYQNNKTEIIKGPLYEVLQPHRTEPAVLSPSDPRMSEQISPMLKSISKYTEPEILPFNRDIMETAFRIVSKMYDPMRNEQFVVCDHNDTINARGYDYIEKLDLSTSAGYPWNTKNISKKDLINMDSYGNLEIKQQLQSQLNTCENMLSRGAMFPYTLLATLKDERVDISKVKIGKTRTFINFPVEYTILLRKYFDAFINAETKYAMEIGTTVGVNIYSTKWQLLFQDLNKYDFHVDGDFKSFDSTIRPEFFRLYTKLVQEMYKDKFGNIRSLLVNGTCFAPMIVLGKVYMKMRGNPSGSRLTTSFNSFVNRMYIVMSMLKKLPGQFHTSDYFRENVKIFAHGDDHIIAFNKDIKLHWDAFDLKDYMLEHNIEYTSSKKDQPLVSFTKIEELYYLKSKFVFIGGKVKCGLDKNVIQEMVSWQRDTSIETTQMIVDTCLRYAYFWGEEYFNWVSNQLGAAITARKLRLSLIEYIDLDIHYNHEGMIAFDYHKI